MSWKSWGKAARAEVRRRSTALLLFLTGGMLLTGCYEPKEGCLDVRAVNFDVSADIDCCCEFPALKVEVLQRFDSLVWLPDQVYTNALGQPFRLQHVALYLSGFEFGRNGMLYGVEDSLLFKVWDPGSADTLERRLRDDIILVRRSPSEYTVGQFSESGAFESLRFRVGAGADARDVIPELAPNGHPLRPQAENLWLGRDTSYAALRLVVVRDTLSGTLPDTLYFTRQDFDNPVIEETRTFNHQTGYDFRVRLTIDYARLLQGVDWQNGDKTVWKNTIANNLSATFSLSQ